MNHHSDHPGERPIPARFAPPFMRRLLALFTRGAVAMVALLLALVLGALLLCLLLSPAKAEEEPVTRYVLVEAGSWLNIRERPAAHADVMIRMERGEELLVYAIDTNGWAEVARAGDSGYCRVEYLCDTPPDAPLVYTASVDQLRVRVLPSAGATTARKLRKGTQVTVLAFLTCDGITWARTSGGFIMAEYLTAEGS